MLLGRKAMINLGPLNSRDITSPTKVHIVKAMYDFSSSHVWMWELDHKEGWRPKNWYFWTVVLEKTLESPLDCKEIQPVNPKRNQSWILTGRIHAEAKAPIFWPLDVKSWLTGKDPDAGKDWRQEKGMTRDEMVGWHHDSMDMNLNKLREMMKDREACCAVVHGITNSWTWLSGWTTATKIFKWWCLATLHNLFLFS